MKTRQSSRSREQVAFERKVRFSRLALLFERLWPRLWLIIATAGLFLVVSLLGVWPHLSDAAHKVVLGVFALALAASCAFVVRVRIPGRDEGLRRLERLSDVPHRPASSYEDTWSAPSRDPAAVHLWQAHKTRLARLLGRLQIAAPRPRTDRHDPFAVRAVLMLAVVLLLALVGDSARDRLMAAFRIGPAPTAVEARLDAWVTPPPYTGRPPMMLADGGRMGPVSASSSPAAAVEVPDRSLLIVRTSGPNLGRLMLEVTDENGAAHRVDAAEGAGAGDVSETRFELRRSVTVRVFSGYAELARWPMTVIPDEPPKITLTKEPERSLRGAMKLTYKVEDDYGVASAEANLERLPVRPGDPRTSWARPDILKGARPPLERPPRLSLRLPPSRAKTAETSSHHELGPHPWAGLRVRMTLLARDHGGNIGKSRPTEITLPMRRFQKPLARAVIEQRRKLAFDPRYRGDVIKALDALTLEPEEYIPDRNVYLGLRSAAYRLKGDEPSHRASLAASPGDLKRLSRAGLKSVMDQLWHVAVRIEDGGSLSDAERRLRDLQEQLSKALEDGAPDAEIQKLMQELRQALADFLQQLARQAEGRPMHLPEGMNPNQIVRPEDLERMLRNIEEMARHGSRDAAQQMLSRLRDLLERLQSGRMADMNRRDQQMMRSLDELGDLIGRQQRLMDDTFGAQRRQNEQMGQQGQQGQQGQRGQRGDRPGQGERQGPGEQGGQQPGLGERQGELRDRLDRLQRGLRGLGVRPPGQFDEAGEAMEDARRALEQGDLDEAGREQGRALERLRQGAQAMMREMLQQMPSNFGQGPNNDVPLDPLGRAVNESRDMDGGSPEAYYPVPGRGEIDAQRAREILEELRRRLGEPTRPLLELDYIERLLRRF